MSITLSLAQLYVHIFFLWTYLSLLSTLQIRSLTLQHALLFVHFLLSLKVNTLKSNILAIIIKIKIEEFLLRYVCFFVVTRKVVTTKKIFEDKRKKWTSDMKFVALEKFNLTFVSFQNPITKWWYFTHWNILFIYWPCVSLIKNNQCLDTDSGGGQQMP